MSQAWGGGLGVVMDGEALFFKGLFKIFWLKIIAPLLKMTASTNNWGRLLHILLSFTQHFTHRCLSNSVFT